MSGMTKIAADSAFAALVTAGPTLRKLAQENQAKDQEIAELKGRVAQLEQSQEVEKLAQEIHQMGLDEGRDFGETVEFLEKKAKAGDFKVYKEAVALSSQRSLLGTPDDSRRVGHDPLEAAVFDE